MMSVIMACGLRRITGLLATDRTTVTAHGRHLRNSDIVCGETAIKPQETFIPGDLSETIHHAVVWIFTVRTLLLLLQSGLHEIEGK